jgi:hypothetical protein
MIAFRACLPAVLGLEWALSYWDWSFGRPLQVSLVGRDPAQSCHSSLPYEALDPCPLSFRSIALDFKPV